MLKKHITIFFLACSYMQIQAWNIISVQELLQKRPDVTYTKCHDAQPFEYKPFPISRFPELQPNKGLLAETFIVKIPNGQVYSWRGIVKVDDDIIQDFFTQYHSLEYAKQIAQKISWQNHKKIKGKVVVLTTLYENVYFHWMYNVLGRLALLDLKNIAYDWIYVSSDKPFMKETLKLWGVDPAKIIEPFGDNVRIEADELIVPSLVGTTSPNPDDFVLTWVPLNHYAPLWGFKENELTLTFNTPEPNVIIPESFPHNIYLRKTPLCGNYFNKEILEFLYKKFIPFSQDMPNPEHYKKIFISRKDANLRNMINEDEIFALFEKKGFVEVDLSKLPVVQQIALFKNAEIIVGAHGAGFTNIIFCQPHTKIVELFQNRSGCSYFYLCQLLGLQHHILKTGDFNNIQNHETTAVSAAIVQDFINNHSELFD